MNIRLFGILSVLSVLLLSIFGMYGCSDKPGSNITGNVAGTDVDFTGDKVKLEFYVMSQCPYGTQVEDGIYPVLKEMGQYIDFRLEFIGRESFGSFQSLHGEPEWRGNMVQLCAAKHDPEKYMDMVVCMNKNMRAIPNNWESCAMETEVDVAKVKECYEGDEGKELLKESFAKAEKAGASGSPTIFLNDQPYSGGRDSLAFKRAICQNLDVEECSSMPECGMDQDCSAEPGKIGKCVNPGQKDAKCEYSDPVKVEVVVLNDKDCSSCDTGQLKMVISQLFLGAEFKEVDANSAEGKELVEENSIMLAPSFLFSGALVDTFNWNNNPRIRTAFEEVAFGYKLMDAATGASHFIDEEARAEHLKTIGVTLGDNKPQIDFFVMSYCPFGNQAEELVEKVYQNLGDSAEYNPRYVIYSNYQGGGPEFCIDNGKLCSMHGIQELNQNIRELCVNNMDGIEAYFKFVLAMNKECDYTNADTCWTAVAEGLGLDTEAISKCEEEQGVELMAKEKELNDKLSVTGSPAIFIDGNKYGGVRSANAMQVALCDAFDTKPAECSNTIAESAQAQAPSQGACG